MPLGTDRWLEARLLNASGSARSGGGLISGVAKGTQSGVLPGVTVTLRNQASGVTRTTVGEGDGS